MDYIKEQVIAEIEKKVQQADLLVSRRPGPNTRDLLYITNQKDQEHEIVVGILDLEKDRSIKIPAIVFKDGLNEFRWILLVLLMDQLPYQHYLIPVSVFENPSQVFINNKQPERWNHLSNLEIKVFRHGIAELSKYDLDLNIGKLL